MTFINWISVSVTAAILIAGIILKIYYGKKLRDMDGFMGITSAEKKDGEPGDKTKF